MCNLLSANFARLRKNRPFIVAIIFMIVYVAVALIYIQFQKSNGSEISFDTLFLNGYGLGGFIAFPGLLLSIVCGIFIGTDFSDGTLRNKIVTGKTREKIYLSNFFTCAFIGIVLNFIYIAVVCIVGLPWLGGIEMPMKSFLYIVVDGTLMMIAYTAIFNMLAILLKDKTTAVVVGMVMTIVSMFLSLYLMMRTFEPEFITTAILIDDKVVEEIVPNSKYLSDNVKGIAQFIIDFLPSGQSIQLSHLTTPNIQYMWLYSLIIIVTTNIVGIFAFKKADLK